MSSDLDGAVWRKSSRSGGNGGECVELATTTHVFGVRDSKNPEVELTFGTCGFDRFLGAVKHCRFDV